MSGAVTPMNPVSGPVVAETTPETLRPIWHRMRQVAKVEFFDNNQNYQ